MSVKAFSSAMLLTLAFGPFHLSRHAHNTDDVVRVRMQRDPDHSMIGIRCQIGTSSGKWRICVIDSGASRTIISDKVLKAEGPIVDITTTNGVVRANARHVRFTIDERLQFDSLVLVQRSNMLPSDIEVLLGQDVLRQFRSVTFDYEKQEVAFHR